MKNTRMDNFQQQRSTDMNISKTISLHVLCAGLLVALLLSLATAAMAGSGPAAPEVKQRVFNTPEDAAQALSDAAKAKDHSALAAIFGPEYPKLLSGDAVQDTRELQAFDTAIEESARLQKANDEKYLLAVGDEQWPFPIPIVKQGEQWRFDTKAGMDEILNRRIGENELSAIATCRAYVLAQWEYFTEGDHDNDGVAEYAQHFISTPGNRDGLYWDTAEGEKPSPMGALVAAARAEGYAPGQSRLRTVANSQAASRRHPYHGYYLKILKAQGPHAPGGRYNYVINGNMIAGYALIAYPDKWGSSGMMTFIVNQQGRVYEKNLGPDTLKIAGAITQYDPDPSWKLVKE